MPMNEQDATAAKVLIVEDNVPLRVSFALLLEMNGYQTVQASGGQEALRMVVEEQPDLVLLDVMIPAPDGIEVCRRIKSAPNISFLPVVILTALSSREDRLRGLEAGADDFCSKPCDEAELLARVRNLVRSKHLHDLVAQRNAELQQLTRLKDDLTHMIIHEMNGPLTSILGWLSILTRSQELSEQGREGVTLALQGVSTLRGMIDNMLDITTLEEGNWPLKLQPFDLGQVIEAVVAERADVLRHRKQKVVLDLPPDLPLWQADQTLIARIITSLLDNASRYSGADGDIIIRARVEDGWQTFQVVDQGPGVPVEYQQAIFEKFRQVEISEAGVAKGTGLGLAFCKLAVETHGGSISVHSPVFECPEEQRKGSAFIVKLPPAPPRTTGDGKRRL